MKFESAALAAQRLNVSVRAVQNVMKCMIEFTIAMLYNRNWRIKEIAFHLEMSERTVKNYLSTIYEKLAKTVYVAIVRSL